MIGRAKGGPAVGNIRQDREAPSTVSQHQKTLHRHGGLRSAHQHFSQNSQYLAIENILLPGAFVNALLRILQQCHLLHALGRCVARRQRPSCAEMSGLHGRIRVFNHKTCKNLCDFLRSVKVGASGRHVVMPARPESRLFGRALPFRHRSPVRCPSPGSCRLPCPPRRCAWQCP